MPRTAHIAQADISRALRAFRSLGIEAHVRITPDGIVTIGPPAQDAGKEHPKLVEEEEIRL